MKYNNKVRLKEDFRYIHCPFCGFYSNIMHYLHKHIFTNHLDKIDTDYDPRSGEWTYWRPKEVKNEHGT